MRIILTVTFLLLASNIVHSQGTPTPSPPPVGFFQFDVYTDIPLEDEWARLDNLAYSLRRDRGVVAHLYVYAGRRSCAWEARARALRAERYLVKQGAQPGQVSWKDAGFREERTVEMYLLPREAKMFPPTYPTVEPGEARVIKNCKRGKRVRRRLDKS
jgi:hypothetical protein